MELTEEQLSKMVEKYKSGEVPLVKLDTSGSYCTTYEEVRLAIKLTSEITAWLIENRDNNKFEFGKEIFYVYLVHIEKRPDWYDYNHIYQTIESGDFFEYLMELYKKEKKEKERKEEEMLIASAKKYQKEKQSKIETVLKVFGIK